MFTVFVLLQLASAGRYTPDPFYTDSTAYQACDRIVTPVSRAIGTPKASLPLTRGPEAPANLTVEGNVVITSGCGFAVEGFSFNNVNESYWYGSYQESDLNRGMILSNVPVVGPGFGNLSTSANAEFPFITTRGQEVSYYGFNQFRIYTKDTNSFVAYADIPLDLTTTKYAPGQFDNNIAPGTAVSVSSAYSSGLDACLMALSAVFVAFI